MFNPFRFLKFLNKPKPLEITPYQKSTVQKSTTINKKEGQFSLGPRPAIDGNERIELEEEIRKNVSLIENIDTIYHSEIAKAVISSLTSANGRNDLVRDLQKYQGMTLEISQLIADDQTRKMNAFLNVRRMKKMGVKKFEWVHVASSHPRKLHEELNGKIFGFDDPPIIQKDPEIRGLPAQLFNCHCQMVPVFDFEERE